MFDKIGKFIKKAVENNLNFILGIGIVGIIMAIVGHYGTVGFDWTMFLCFELPLYIFQIQLILFLFALYFLT